jgi:hypothetical protein
MLRIRPKPASDDWGYDRFRVSKAEHASSHAPIFEGHGRGFLLSFTGYASMVQKL